MKTLKVYEDVHTAVKVDAAQQGRTTTYAASAALRKFYGLPDAAEEPEEEEEPASRGRRPLDLTATKD